MCTYHSTPRYLPKRNENTLTQTCTLLFLAALFLRAPNWKPPSVHRLVNKQTGPSAHWNTTQGPKGEITATRSSMREPQKHYMLSDSGQTPKTTNSDSIYIKLCKMQLTYSGSGQISGCLGAGSGKRTDCKGAWEK